jgi:type I restriction enzyme S subunit
MAGDLTKWDAVPLDELTEDETPITYGVVKPGEEGDVPFVRGGDIAGGRVLMNQLRTIGRDISQQYRRTLLRGGEILVSLVGNPGQVAIAPPELAGANIARQVGLVRLKPGIDTRFVSYFLQSHEGQAAFGSQSRGSVQQVINLRDLRTLTVPLPPLPEQRAIAHILGTLDDKIELNRLMNETLEAIARALFKSWFVDFDPVRSKMSGEPPESICQRLGLTPDLLALFPDRIVESEHGETPKEWSTVSLYEIATYINGAAYSAFEPNEMRRGLPIIKIAELKAGVTEQTKYSNVDMPEKYRINQGEILFSWSGNPDTSIDTFVWTNGPAWLNQHIFRVVPPSELDRPFVLALLKSLRPVFSEIARNKQTTGLGHVTVSDLKKLTCVKPPKSLLVKWNEIVGPILDRIFLSDLETQTLKNHRDTLLPRLLSGELRVSEADSDVDLCA